MTHDPESRLRELGLELPPVPEPAGAYVPAARTGNLVFTAGQLPLWAGELINVGKVGEAVSPEEAYECARLCALNGLAAIAAAAGSLSRVRRVVKVTGFVASTQGFNAQAQILNGASELIGDVFGEAGLHARSAVGVAELPLDAPVEVELVAELDA